MDNLKKMVQSLYLTNGVIELAKELDKTKEATSFSTSAGMLLLENNEEVQVQIIVTRDKEQFLGEFDVVQHNQVIYK